MFNTFKKQSVKIITDILNLFLTSRKNYIVSIRCSDENSVYGTKCRIFCDEGYQIDGSSVRVCQDYGEYDGVETTCSSKLYIKNKFLNITVNKPFEVFYFNYLMLLTYAVFSNLILIIGTLTL